MAHGAPSGRTPPDSQAVNDLAHKTVSHDKQTQPNPLPCVPLVPFVLACPAISSRQSLGNGGSLGEGGSSFFPHWPCASTPQSTPNPVNPGKNSPSEKFRTPLGAVALAKAAHSAFRTFVSFMVFISPQTRNLGCRSCRSCRSAFIGTNHNNPLCLQLFYDFARQLPKKRSALDKSPSLGKVPSSKALEPHAQRIAVPHAGPLPFPIVLVLVVVLVVATLFLPVPPPHLRDLYVNGQLACG
ncbi:MAG: hypothetical protein JWR19_1620 [Pedosphaera sp.]|nr:hypothetical protein [Pedosphaera sp.]